jgi:formate C-acetyltransferase
MMMFVWIYFFFSEHLDGIQCRSLTELDVFIGPYYEADIAAGRTTEAEFREQMRHFLWQWGSAANYYAQPIGFGGTKKDGSSEFGKVSRIILEIADELNLTSPKFIVKVADNTPDWAWRMLLDMARRRRSVAFLGEEPAAKALKRWKNASDEDCRTMAVRGCYEFGLCDSLNTTDAANLNLLMPVVRMLEDNAECRMQNAECPGSAGFQPAEVEQKLDRSAWPDFDAFLAEYLRRVAEVTMRSREVVGELEKVLSEVNPANLMALATEHALRTRRDGFLDGCPRGNDTTIRALGLGSAVDALLAVKELVYEKGEFTLAELGAIMAANWEGHEALRLRMLRSKRKWGNNDREANALGARIIETFASNMNGFPNSRGGIFLASGHSSRRFIELGRKTPASPDGRRAGEELSKNLSPTMGADTEGATALVSTLAASSADQLPSDYPLDVLLHPSVCQGEEGLEAMRALVRVYHRNGGGVIQFTVFSVEELRDAQAHPEKYESLQVRICGWNVRWNDMCKAEQDAYIRRAENVVAL